MKSRRFRRWSTGRSRRTSRGTSRLPFVAKLSKIDGENAELQRRGLGEVRGERAREAPARRQEDHREGTAETARTALHHQQAPAGRRAKARLHREADDDGGAAPLRRNRARPGGSGRTHLLHAHRLHPHRRRGDRRGAPLHRRAIRGSDASREAELLQEQEGRPGRARGHPPDLGVPRPGHDRSLPRPRRAQALSAHLDALRRLADASRGLRRDHRRDRSGPLPPPRARLGHEVQRFSRDLRRGPRRRAGEAREEGVADRFERRQRGGGQGRRIRQAAAALRGRESSRSSLSGRSSISHSPRRGSPRHRW